MSKNKIKMVLSLAVCSLILGGCSATELEERCFPMMAAAEIEENKLSYKYAFTKEDDTGKLGAKEKDYSHLKVLVLEDELLEHTELYDAMLEEQAETENFPRNTYVCVMDDIEDLFEMEQEISQDLGTYLEEYLKKHEEKKGKLLTLGDLIDEKENQTMILYLPYLDVEENILGWKGYVNTSGKSWQESK